MKTWPNDRRISAIEELHALNTRESLEANTNKLSILANLPTNPTIVDLGMGQGNFLIDLACHLKKRAKLIGVSASPAEINWEQCRYAGVEIVKGKLPHEPNVREFLKTYAGKVDRVFDTYGPATYAQNPLHSLIFAAFLLKPQGEFSAISSTDNQGHTVFGDKETQQKLVEFFQKELGITIHFQFTAIKSRVTPGAINEDLLIHFTRDSRDLSVSDYLKLCRKADKVIGIPVLSNPSWYQYGEFSIAPRQYRIFTSLPEKKVKLLPQEEERHSSFSHNFI
ncbi:class I SAM-dependent methyltransferase [Legionella brunensis]|uniref:Methyltransferase domain-containing protein n=1 Tax=Legionella brunensis TaxID=29422 RepID=A0A0W0S0J3_9GAMM|nr:class I SAM-dependent methyltransferase [Legionella brunensis]KTC76846.1 hypothetical protein Lbru_2953 [Legionella brunensis]